MLHAQPRLGNSSNVLVFREKLNTCVRELAREPSALLVAIVAATRTYVTPGYRVGAIVSRWSRRVVLRVVCERSWGGICAFGWSWKRHQLSEQNPRAVPPVTADSGRYWWKGLYPNRAPARRARSRENKQTDPCDRRALPCGRLPAPADGRCDRSCCEPGPCL